MPVIQWRVGDSRTADMKASSWSISAEVGGLSLEFTRLSQLTGEMKYYDAISQIMEAFEQQQMKTKLPGMWPVTIDAAEMNFQSDALFSVAGMADSMYEYLIKQHILLGGGAVQYQKMYELALKKMKRYVFFEAVVQHPTRVLFTGQYRVVPKQRLHPEAGLRPEAQHSGCFAGGMVALASRILKRPAEMETARALVEGCLWAYEKTPRGMMPEVMLLTPCPAGKGSCVWNETLWHEEVQFATEELESPAALIEKYNLTPGVGKVSDARYLLRPEAIESLFILYRVTGDQSLPDRAWSMFNSIVSQAKAEFGHAELSDCTSDSDTRVDRMDAYWLGGTLKYFYLMYSEPNVISLDDYVFNIRGHPLKRPR